MKDEGCAIGVPSAKDKESSPESYGQGTEYRVKRN